jgi:hypothetical protein
MSEVTITAEQARAWEASFGTGGAYVGDTQEFNVAERKPDVGYVAISKKELRELKEELEQLSFVTAKEVKTIEGWLLRK